MPGHMKNIYIDNATVSFNANDGSLTVIIDGIHIPINTESVEYLSLRNRFIEGDLISSESFKEDSPIPYPEDIHTFSYTSPLGVLSNFVDNFTPDFITSNKDSVIDWNMSQHPNMIVLGQPGSGKTAVLRTIVKNVQKSASKYIIKIVDPDARNFNEPVSLNTTTITTHEVENNELHKLRSIIKYRSSSETHMNSAPLSYLLVLDLTPDELSAFPSGENSDLDYILQYGPAVGVQTVISVSYVDYATYSKIAEFIPAKIITQRISEELSYTVLNDSIASQISDKFGSSLAVFGESAPVMFTRFYIPEGFFTEEVTNEHEDDDHKDGYTS